MNIVSRIAGLAFALLACAPAAAAPDMPDAAIAVLNEQLQEDAVALDAFARARSKRMASGASGERPGSWLLYGRLGALRFRRALEPQSEGFRFSVVGGSGGPAALPGGRIRIGVYRRFD